MLFCTEKKVAQMIRGKPPARYHSRCKDIEIRGLANEIISKYEGLAYQALREERISDAHELFQHADHYKRVENE